MILDSNLNHKLKELDDIIKKHCDSYPQQVLMLEEMNYIVKNLTEHITWHGRDNSIYEDLVIGQFSLLLFVIFTYIFYLDISLEEVEKRMEESMDVKIKNLRSWVNDKI